MNRLGIVIMLGLGRFGLIYVVRLLFEELIFGGWLIIVMFIISLLLIVNKFLRIVNILCMRC